MVPQPSTNRALRRLTSEVGRDLVYSARYGRQRPRLRELHSPMALGPKYHKKMVTLLDLCVSSLRRGHANLLCIVPILTDDPRRESNHFGAARHYDHRSHFGSRYKLGCCGNASLLFGSSNPVGARPGAGHQAIGSSRAWLHVQAKVQRGQYGIGFPSGIIR